MEWISQFFWPFIIPLGIFTVLFAGGYWSDNTSYPWKHWTKEQTIGGFAMGPAFAFLIASLAMMMSLLYQPFIFERWFTAGTFFFLSSYLFRSYCPAFFVLRSKEEVERIRQEWESQNEARSQI